MSAVLLLSPLYLSMLLGPAEGATNGSMPLIRNPAAVDVECKSGDDVLSVKNVQLESKAANFYKASIRIINKKNITFGSITLLSGTCASQVDVSELDKIQFRNGAVYQIISGQTRPLIGGGPPTYGSSAIVRSSIPSLDGGEFVNASVVERARTIAGLEIRYVGLWKQQKRWLIGEFKALDGGKTTSAVVPLLTSDTPLRSVSYFPAPDTPSGGLSIVQAFSPTDTRVLHFSWWHGKSKR